MEILERYKKLFKVVIFKKIKAIVPAGVVLPLLLKLDVLVDVGDVTPEFEAKIVLIYLYILRHKCRIS